jgi:hypothetical protein
MVYLLRKFPDGISLGHVCGFQVELAAVVSRLAYHLHQLKHQAEQLETKDSAQRWRQWLQEGMPGGAGRVHRWIEEAQAITRSFSQGRAQKP